VNATVEDGGIQLEGSTFKASAKGTAVSTWGENGVIHRMSVKAADGTTGVLVLETSTS
jgi:hypothetical protein